MVWVTLLRCMVLGGARLLWLGRSRDQVASLVGGRAGGVVFTAGATEANNLALRGHCGGGGGRQVAGVGVGG